MSESTSLDCPQKIAERNELFLQTLRALSNLPDQQRLIVSKRIFDQMTFLQIASELDITIDATRRAFEKAIQSAKVELSRGLPGFEIDEKE